MILAVDTSCYTTSMIAIDIESGRQLFELNQNLAVKPGERGLRQSEGFFQHVHRLTESFDMLCKQFEAKKIKAIAVSSRPRPVENSYMPVFHAGLLFASNIANALSVPLYQYSHQEGHLMAAICTSELTEVPKRFYGLHLSGGTTEILDVISHEDGFEIELLGGTLDLNFGQLIDRIGVKLGLAFPCGKALDEFAQINRHNDSFKVKLGEPLAFNLSGLENKYLKLIETESIDYCASHIFNTIAEILKKILVSMPLNQPIILSGGVSANSIVKEILIRDFKRQPLYFAKPEYARDNALGVAELGRIKFLKEQ